VTVFADTSALYAVLDRDDTYHQRASEAWRTLLSGDDPVATTNYVVVETAALVQNRLGLEALRTLVDDVLPALEVEWITEEDHHSALGAVLAAGRRRLSLVDCSSFRVLRRLGIREVFAFDAHFVEQGFELLP
jgi:uncharacterized protein